MGNICILYSNLLSLNVVVWNYRSYTWALVGFNKLRKYENMKISVSVNPNGVMRSIMYVLDDFAGFGSFFILSARIFKNGLENPNF